MSRVLTLLTDFGWADPWLAEVRGALHSAWARWPEATPRPAVVDLGHDIPPGDVAAGAWFLERAARCYPAGTVHLAVVDPGVGSARPAVACRAGGRFFVGPGNGLLGCCSGAADLQVVRIEACALAGHPATGRVSATFHGRDLFAPAAALLAMGAPLEQLGPAAPATDLGTAASAAASGPRIVWIDRFGNAITDLARESAAGRRLAAGATLKVAGQPVPGPREHYAAAEPGRPFWYWGSGETLEIAVPGGCAAALLNLERGLALALPEP